MKTEYIKLSRHIVSKIGLTCYSIVHTTEEDLSVYNIDDSSYSHLYSILNTNVFLIKFEIINLLPIPLETLCTHLKNKIMFLQFPYDFTIDAISSYLLSIRSAFLLSGEAVLLPYHDSEFLNKFIPLCNPEQLISFMGPINEIILEDIEKGFVSYSKENNLLKCTILSDVMSLEKINKV